MALCSNLYPKELIDLLIFDEEYDEEIELFRELIEILEEEETEEFQMEKQDLPDINESLRPYQE